MSGFVVGREREGTSARDLRGLWRVDSKWYSKKQLLITRTSQVGDEFGAL